MSEPRSNGPEQYPAEIYEIRVKGHLQQKRAALFEDLTLTCQEDGTTVLRGPLPDQTALHSVLLRIRNMNLELISVRQIREDAEGNPKTGATRTERSSDEAAAPDASETVAGSEPGGPCGAPSADEQQPPADDIDLPKNCPDSVTVPDQQRGDNESGSQATPDRPRGRRTRGRRRRTRK